MITGIGISPYPHFRRGGGAANEPEVDLYIAGLSTALSAAQESRLNTFVAELKTGLSITALSDAFDGLWLLAGETAESSLKNLVKNAHYATAVNSPTFTTLEGFKGDGATSYIDTNYNTLNDQDNYVQNSGSIGVYSRTNMAELKAEMGALTATTGAVGCMTIIRNAVNEFIGMINAANTGTTIGANTDSTGMYIITRNSATHNQGYKNGSLVANVAKVSAAAPNADLFLLARSLGTTPTILSARQISFAFIAKGLSQDDVTAVTNAIEAYMDSNGKGVIA